VVTIVSRSASGVVVLVMIMSGARAPRRAWAERPKFASRSDYPMTR
jgi:hypothetical protein